MSYSCTKHGWQHLLNPCPSCYTVTSASSLAEIEKERDEYVQKYLDESQNVSRPTKLVHKELFDQVSNDLERSSKLLSELVESIYMQKPRPGTSVNVKMKLKASIDYLKSKGINLPEYDKAIEEYKKSKETSNG